VCDPVAQADQADEYLMMGMRLADGIDRIQFARIVGRPLDACIDGAKVAALCDAGLLVADQRGLRATSAGMLRLNAIIAAITV
jgi:oxygen-independent coproporphyrinogen-3 oxidase